MNLIDRLVTRAGRRLGLHVLTHDQYKTLEEHKRTSKLLNRLTANQESSRFRTFACTRLVTSHSQSLQDLFALFCHPDDPGFFVEFGAGDGKTISNTLLLEQNYGWSGVLCEPALVFRTSLESSRGCSLDFRCVSAQSGKRVTFAENLNPDMSGIQESAGQKYKKSHARTAKTYEVETISLLDLLTHHNAPRRINFLSIDTEGTEFDILYKFDFSSFAIDALTVEHNFGRDRQATRDLLSSHGFVRVEEELSEQDDWYVSAEIFETRWSS